MSFNFKGLFKSSDGEIIQTSLFVVQFKDNDGITVLYAPALEVYGTGYTTDQAKQSFEIGLKEFIRYTKNKGTLYDELIRMGWQIKSNRKKKELINPGIQELLKKNKDLSMIMNKPSATTFHTKIPLAIPASA